MEISRNQQNFIIMTIIYEALLDASLHQDCAFRSFEELINTESLTSIISANDDIDEVKTNPYIINCVNMSLSKYNEIVSILSPKLVNWKWERIPLLTRAILLMSVAHYKYVEKIDKRIVIDVAINLAKKYIEEKQAKFIHAILDGVLIDAI